MSFWSKEDINAVLVAVEINAAVDILAPKSL